MSGSFSSREMGLGAGSFNRVCLLSFWFLVPLHQKFSVKFTFGVWHFSESYFEWLNTLIVWFTFSSPKNTLTGFCCSWRFLRVPHIGSLLICKFVIFDLIFGKSTSFDELPLSMTLCSTNGSTEYLIPLSQVNWPSRLSFSRAKQTMSTRVIIVHRPPIDVPKVVFPL